MLDIVNDQMDLLSSNDNTKLEYNFNELLYAGWNGFT